MTHEEELFWAAIDRSLAPETKQVSREQLRSRVGKALTNAMNYPRAVRPHILGRDLSGLIDSVIDALLASDLFAIPVDADTYRISYQKYWLTTPGNFASVRDAVEDAFRAGWEAHTPHAVDRPIETSPGGVGFARRKGWLADPTLNPYQKEQNDEH